MADEENRNEATDEAEKSKQSGTSETAAASNEGNAPAGKKAPPRKKTTVKKKAVKKRAAPKKAAAKKAAEPAPAAKSDSAEKLAATGTMGSGQETRAEPAKRFWWRATIMIVLVVLFFMYIREMAKESVDEMTPAAVETATLPAEGLEQDSATTEKERAPQAAQSPAMASDDYARPHPWMPPYPQAAPGDERGAGEAATPPLYPAPSQGYYGYPQPYPAPPEQQGEAMDSAPRPYYPAPPQGYYGYPQQHPWQPPYYPPEQNGDSGYYGYPPQYPSYPAPYQQ